METTDAIDVNTDSQDFSHDVKGQTDTLSQNEKQSMAADATPERTKRKSQLQAHLDWIQSRWREHAFDTENEEKRKMMFGLIKKSEVKVITKDGKDIGLTIGGKFYNMQQVQKEVSRQVAQHAMDEEQLKSGPSIKQKREKIEQARKAVQSQRNRDSSDIDR